MLRAKQRQGLGSLERIPAQPGGTKECGASPQYSIMGVLEEGPQNSQVMGLFLFCLTSPNWFSICKAVHTEAGALKGEDTPIGEDAARTLSNRGGI